ncbi:hypothetical protein M3Y96_01033400 [Aphelenchoides besseyi]|nr:hypothetical protein M3Y96_01033400 [Aphelenchoides besseyi]
MRCKFCRFQASIIAGFNISSVIVRPIPNEISCFEPTTVFERLNICNRAKFVNRFFYLVQVHDGRFENVRIGIPNPSAVEIFRLLEAEFLVMLRYLEQCGFSQCDLSAEMIRQLAHVVFQEWIVFQCVVATANNNGKMTQEFYLPDESHLNVTVEHLTNCVRMLNGQIDKDVLARAGVSYLTEVLETAAIYQQARLDNREFAAMVQLLLLREASKLFPENAATRRFTHTIFQALQQHYELNFEETPIRIGQIVSLIDQIGSLSFSLNELVIMWKLNGIDSIFRLPAQISPQFTLASGPVSSLYTPPSSCTSLSDDLCSV